MSHHPIARQILSLPFLPSRDRESDTGKKRLTGLERARAHLQSHTGFFFCCSFASLELRHAGIRSGPCAENDDEQGSTTKNVVAWGAQWGQMGLNHPARRVRGCVGVCVIRLAFPEQGESTIDLSNGRIGSRCSQVLTWSQRAHDEIKKGRMRPHVLAD